MKRSHSVMLLAILISFIAVFPVNAGSNRPKKDIDIVVAWYPKPHINRTPIQSIEAGIDTENNMVDVTFNEEFGAVIIYIQNQMGQTIAKYECDTNTESQAYIFCNLESDGVYAIKIFGKDLEASGYFDLRE